MSWRASRRTARTPPVAVASHGCSHTPLSTLASDAIAPRARDFAHASAGRKARQGIDAIAYPNGDHDDSHRGCARRRLPHRRSPPTRASSRASDDPLRLRRVNIHEASDGTMPDVPVRDAADLPSPAPQYPMQRILVTDGDTVPRSRPYDRSGGRSRGDHRRDQRIRARCRLAHSAGPGAYPDPIATRRFRARGDRHRLRERGVDVLLPMTEITHAAAHAEPASAAAGVQAAVCGRRAIARAANKAEVIALAARLGVPIPRTIVIAIRRGGARRTRHR